MRKVFVVTERRADFSRFKPILELISNDEDLDYDLVVNHAFAGDFSQTLMLNEIFQAWKLSNKIYSNRFQ